MSIANSLVMEKIAELTRDLVLKTGKQEKTYIGEAELPAYFFSFGGSIPSDIGYGLLLDEPCVLKKFVYYNLGTADDFLMTLKIMNYDTNEELKTFSVDKNRLVLELNIPTQGMIGVEIVSHNETDELLSRHRVILYTY